MALQSNGERDDSNGSPEDVAEQQMLIEASAWSGPLPKPDILRQYNEILPGAADRILKMAEEQQKHHHNQDRLQLDMYLTALRSDSRRSNLGLAAGLLVTLMGLGGGIFLVYAGHDAAGAAIAGLNLLGLAGVFVYGTHSRRADRADRTNGPIT